MMDEVYLYFRAQTTLSADQDDNDSCCFPLSSFAGCQVSTGNGRISLNMFFKSMKNYDGRDQADNTETISDYVTLTINPVGSSSIAKEAISEIVQKLNSAKYKQKGFVTVADEITGEYISDRITACNAIVIAAVHA